MGDFFFWGGGGSFLCNLGSFFKVKVHNGGFFFGGVGGGGLLKFQIFFLIVEIPDFFFLREG